MEFFSGDAYLEKGVVPRCDTCRIRGAIMPTEDTKPNGSEDVEVAPCGCALGPAALEIYFRLKGGHSHFEQTWQPKATDPTKSLSRKTIGVHRNDFFAMWEILNGDWSMAAMLNTNNARVKQVRELEEWRSSYGRVVEADKAVTKLKTPQKPRKRSNEEVDAREEQPSPSKKPQTRKGKGKGKKVVDDEE